MSILDKAHQAAALINQHRSLIDRTATTIDIPKGVTQIGIVSFSELRDLVTVNLSDEVEFIEGSAFQYDQKLERISGGENVTSIGHNAFRYCSKLNNFPLMPKLLRIFASAFDECNALTSFTIPDSVTFIGMYAFRNNPSTANSTGLNALNIGALSSNTQIQGSVFANCKRLEFVTIKNGFNATNLDLSASTRYSHDTILSWFIALSDRTGEAANTFIIGSTNRAKMSAEEIAIATNKNWNLT